MIKGSCLCNAVRYELLEPPEELSNCHCSHCRKSHGAAFATYAHVKANTLRFTAGEKSLVSYRSSTAGKRRFCPTCGSSILFLYDKMPEVAWVAAGTLDDDPVTRPTEHIFVSSKVVWHEISDAIEQHDEFPQGFDPE